LGFDQQTFDSLVLGITQAIVNAHINMQAGRIFISQGEVDDFGVNRSPYAYNNNPASERAQYADSVDKTVTQLRFMNSANNQVLGAFNFVAGEKLFNSRRRRNNFISRFSSHRIDEQHQPIGFHR